MQESSESTGGGLFDT